jgi:hypothetical protein
VIARNILVEDLTAITGKFGKIKDDTVYAGTEESSNFWNLETGEFRVGNTRSCEDSSHSGNDDQRAEYLHYVPGQGFFQKIKNFIVSSVLSILWGEFKVFRVGQDKTARPVFHTNPGSIAGKESSEFRGAFRVRKNTAGDTNGETAVLEALPNGNVNIPGLINSAGFLKTFKTLDLSALNENTCYPVTASIIRGKGFFEVIVGVFLNSGTKPSWSTHTNGFACFQHMLVLPSGWSTISPLTICLGRTASWMNDASVPPVGWSQMNNGSTAVLWLRGGGKYHVWDSANTAWAIQTAAYTINEQTVQPQATQVFEFTRSAIYANLNAVSATVTGDARVSGALIATTVSTLLAQASMGIDVGNPGGSFIGITGDMIEFYQGGVMKAQIKLGMVTGMLSLLVSGGLLTACNGIVSQGDIKQEIVDSSVSWTPVGDPKFGTNTIQAIAYGSGKFVAGGNGGKAAYSADGVTWTPVSDSKLGTSAIYSIAYGGGKFVAGGNGGKAAYSADGVTWTAAANPQFEGETIQAIAYGGGKFVAVGDIGKASYSVNGSTWSVLNDTTFGTASIYAIVYGNSKFVAVGASGKAAYWAAFPAKLVFSNNGTLTWARA